MQWIILGFGAFSGLAGLLVGGPNNRSKVLAISLLMAVLSFPLNGLFATIPLVCKHGGGALLLAGVQTTGETLPHTGVVPLSVNWQAFTILRWLVFASAVLGLVFALMSPQFKYPARIIQAAGAVLLLFAIAGLAGLTGPHLDMHALHSLAMYGGLAKIPDSIEAFQPSVTCHAGAILSRRVFLFAGAMGIVALLSGLGKFISNMSMWMLFIAVGYAILLPIAFQFLSFPSVVRALDALMIILGIAAIIERDTSFATGLSVSLFGLLMVLPFL